jgi:hypothetical protein
LICDSIRKHFDQIVHKLMEKQEDKDTVLTKKKGMLPFPFFLDR